jgi:hypothetical protein
MKKRHRINLAYMRLLNAIFKRKQKPVQHEQVKRTADEYDYKPAPAWRWRPFRSRCPCRNA